MYFLFIFNKSKQKNLESLEITLKQAKLHYKQISDFFHKTVLPFYEKIENPDEINTALFEENKSTYEESKAAVENIEFEIKQLKDSGTEIIQTLFDEPVVHRIPNLNIEIVKKIAENLGLRFTNEKENNDNTFAPIDILDYIYAVLHSPTYREKYKEFLKIDFPKVPYPKDLNSFWNLVKLGAEIRQIHLLESPIVEKFITQYPIDGNNLVTKPKYQDSKVYINDKQYFDNVPQIAWEFYIGGYQPAQKWLKDRKDRKLDFEDILHYQKIIVALTETDRIMKKIDKIDIE